MMFLSAPFFITAILYAAVGFGGGSTYNALLVLADVDYKLIPVIALICNLIVVSGGVYYFYRSGHVDFKRIIPWMVTSVPAAWLGGHLNISETLFIGLLGFSLLLAGIRMVLSGKKITKIKFEQYKFIPFIFGGVLGAFAGLVGIGGGIFLAPILYLLRWDSSKKIAATCSVFILVNSLSGLIGQGMKLSDTAIVSDITAYWLLFPAVFVGGQIGSHMGLKILDPRVVRLMTAALILYVSLRLILRWLAMAF